MFFCLKDTLDQKHPMFILAEKINWQQFEDVFSRLYCSDNGRPALPIRLMVGLLILKHLRNISDESVVEQYCSNIYAEKLKSLGIKISMSEQANPYENAVAERVNGILKQEFMLDKTFPDIMTARKAVKEDIRIYNEKRPHMSLGYKTPEQVYKAQNELSTY
jgi:transposase InsO family protein